MGIRVTSQTRDAMMALLLSDPYVTEGTSKEKPSFQETAARCRKLMEALFLEIDEWEKKAARAQFSDADGDSDSEVEVPEAEQASAEKPKAPFIPPHLQTQHVADDHEGEFVIGSPESDGGVFPCSFEDNFASPKSKSKPKTGASKAASAFEVGTPPNSFGAEFLQDPFSAMLKQQSGTKSSPSRKIQKPTKREEEENAKLRDEAIRSFGARSGSSSTSVGSSSAVQILGRSAERKEDFGKRDNTGS
ncbi:MAG: hypothetical protein H0X51_07290 [Parachlamydiaceae bacterium]|nr:hypothetical protein [Parachlamydiaceae bacterium]